MKTLSFFGLIAATGLFILTWFLMNQNCIALDDRISDIELMGFNMSCDCSFELSDKIMYILLSSVFSIFYLFYSILFLFRIKESTIKIRRGKQNILDDTFVEQEHSIYEHSGIRVLTITGVIMSTGLLIFAYLCNEINCNVLLDCIVVGCSSNFFYNQEIYTIGYGVIGVYLMVLTLIGLFKSHPSKY